MSLKGSDPFADPRRALLLELFRAAIAAVDGRRRVRAALAGGADAAPVSAFAVGKAAASMMLGARDALGARLERGLVVAPEGAAPPELAGEPGLRCLEAGHPRPDERSLAAGEALLAFAAATPPGSRVLLLVSGGASALIEVPAPGVGLADLAALYDRSLAERLDIEQLNRERAALSRVKGGGLARLFRGARVEALMISDVPRDDPAVLASGLLDSPALAPRLVGSLEDALDAAYRAAIARGLRPSRGAARLAGDAEAEARRICHEFAVGDADLAIHGGETVVRLPARPGRGGRCQHLALAAALCIEGHTEYLVLAAGTDGRDGASEDAGAIVDGATLERARDAGLEPADALAAADAGTLLEATGDLVHTGPTGTNVGDIVLALRRAPAANSPM
jgi:hydroxypyruvate reductase